jgi:hypothetical protein
MMAEPSDEAGLVTLVGYKRRNLGGTGDEDSSKKKKTRKGHTLPPELSLLTDRDRDKFKLVLEIDKTRNSAMFQKEFLVAQSVSIPAAGGNTLDPLLPSPPSVFDLNLLTVDTLWRLCTNLGILNAGSLSKFNCRKAIANFFQHQNSLAINGIRPT